jgi:serine/threonine-protein kinase HipA
LIGNEDMHLKNFSVIRRREKVELSPAYDLLNSTIVINAREELALPLYGKKNNLKKDDFLVYFAKERLELTSKIIDQTLGRMVNMFPGWIELVEKSFLSKSMKTRYVNLIDERFRKLDLRN